MFFEVKKKYFYLSKISLFFSCYSEENSSQLINQENTNIEQDKSELLKNLVNLTPRNIAIMELITSEQRFVHDLKNILKVI
jgi:hypothetical protein